MGIIVESDAVVKNNTDSYVHFTQFLPMVTFGKPKV